MCKRGSSERISESGRASLARQAEHVALAAGQVAQAEHHGRTAPITDLTERHE